MTVIASMALITSVASATPCCLEDEIHSSVSYINIDEKPDSPTHQGEGHCPAHRSNCCHLNVFLMNKETQPVFEDKVAQDRFSEAQSFIKPGPFLDGPFQPPKA